jgi:hypothetical protein
MMHDRASAVCALCGVMNDVALSEPVPDSDEPPDFDTRPAEPLRSTIADWIQCCQACGYCAEDISRASEGADDIVRSDAYREWLNNSWIPAKARQFLAFAYLLERLHLTSDAGWSALHAAWVCDDASDDVAARRCRARAIELWQRGKAQGQIFCDDMASEFALVTDLYRRMGQFEHAAVACAEALDLYDLPPAVEAMLRRQRVLIQARDTAAHSMSELRSAD